MRKVRARAPLRIGIAGGGTDISPYCDTYTGHVLNATIDRYAYCTIEEKSDNQITFESTDRHLSLTQNLEAYPFLLDDELKLLKATYNRMMSEYHQDKPLPLKMTTYCDSPVGSGLGTSSTLVVAMIKAFDEYLKIGLDDYDVAHLAYEIERIDCQLSGGRQDQYSAAFGGFNFMEFYGENRVLVNPLRIKNWVKYELENSILLHYTGQSRQSAKVIQSQVSALNKQASNTLDHMHEIKASALFVKEALLRGSFDDFVEHLNASWESKRKTSSEVSNAYIDETIAMAKQAGALGAKVSGAGGGGFIMYFVPPEKRHQVIQTFKARGDWVSNCHFSMEGSECWTIS